MIRKYTVCLLIISLLVTTLVIYADNTEGFKTNPISDEFLNYIENPELYTGGYIPSPAAPLPGSPSSGRTRVGTPIFDAKFDPRTAYSMPAVRDQGLDGNCWAFSAFGSVEINMMRSAAAESIDYSERHMVETAGSSPTNPYSFDFPINGGGNRDMATAYLSRRAGAVFESDAPYNKPITGTAPTKRYGTDVLYIRSIGEPGGSASAELRSDIKQAILDYGGVFTAYATVNDLYNLTHNSYAAPLSDETPINHACVIVGWDDNFSASKFSIPQPGNGAWLVRGSWGSSFADGGYYYISYYDGTICTEATVFTGAKNTTDYENIYLHDPFGMTGYIYFAGAPQVSIAAKYNKRNAGEKVEAIGVYVAQKDVTYDFYVDGNGDDGISAASDMTPLVTKSFKYSGYYTVPLPSPIDITGSSFAVVTTMKTNDGSTVLIPSEHADETFSSKAVSAPGEGFFIVSTLSKKWNDVYNSDTPRSLCLRAYTNSYTLPYRLDIQKVSATQVGVTAEKGLAASIVNGSLIIVQYNKDGIISNIEIEDVSMGTDVFSDVGQYNVNLDTKRIKAILWDEANSQQPIAGQAEISLP